MNGRGLFLAATLIAIALGCLSITRKIERERRLLRKLRRRGVLVMGDLTENERDTAESLAAVGLLDIRQGRCALRTNELGLFNRKRLRLMVMGGFGAFLLAVVVTALILRR